MNKQECDILKALYKDPFINQRFLSELSGHSLGVVNKSLRTLAEQGYLTEDFQLTKLAEKEFNQKSPRKAIILAAGFGMRMVPINMETPKALIKVNEEILIERQIRQLHEVGITDIYIVVGFMKEQFEYLMDDYGVKLIVNPEYSRKNNLHSMKLAIEHLSNAYVIPCDIWCERNPYSRHELYSWYMVSDLIDDSSEVRVNRKMELVRVPLSDCGNTMVGISYITEEDAVHIRENILNLCADSENDSKFWEEALFDKDRMLISAKLVHSSNVVEINTYEQLRDLDNESEYLHTKAIQIISKNLSIAPEEITDIAILKKGMTNRSFLFSDGKQKFIMRIPGEGTEQLINRKEEAEVYQIIRDKHLCDDILYINPDNGYKITKYLDNARPCNPSNMDDVKHCMKVLRNFHLMDLKVKHSFDIFKQIDFYETLWNGKPSVYRHYTRTKENVFSLKNYIESHIDQWSLTHVDAVPDNFLFTQNKEGQEEIRLIDWEYAGLQDPHVDIAMFAIYALYTKDQVDQLIDIYFEGTCSVSTRIKIYCYIAACGLLWSNWCEYKQHLGVEFGEYSLRQYRYAKDFYRFAISAIET